jgi:DNA-binding NtrC family response regulator
MTAHPTVDTALEAMRLGVCDYVVKPFRLKEIECVMNDAVERHAERQQVRQLRERVSELEERLADLSRSDRRRKIRLARVAETAEFAVPTAARSVEVIENDDEPTPRVPEAVRRAVVTTER